MQNTWTVDDYKAKLGYGSRANLYLIQLRFPAILGIDSKDEDEFSILCEKGTLPATRPITAIDLPFMGDFARIAGDKGAEPDLTFTFRNTEDLKLRNLFELWIETIQTDFTGIRTSPTLYKAPSFFVNQLDKTKTVIKRVELIGAWPLTISPIEVSLATPDISTTDVTIALDGHRTVSI